MSRRDALKQLFEGTIALVGGLILIGLAIVWGSLPIRWILFHV